MNRKLDDSDVSSNILNDSGWEDTYMFDIIEIIRDNINVESIDIDRILTLVNNSRLVYRFEIYKPFEEKLESTKSHSIRELSLCNDINRYRLSYDVFNIISSLLEQELIHQVRLIFSHREDNYVLRIQICIRDLLIKYNFDKLYDTCLNKKNLLYYYDIKSLLAIVKMKYDFRIS